MHLAGLGQGDCATNTTPGQICGYESSGAGYIVDYTPGTTADQMANPSALPLSPGAITEALSINTGLPSGSAFNPYEGIIYQQSQNPTGQPITPTPSGTAISTTGTGPMGPTPLPAPSTSWFAGISNSTVVIVAGMLGVAVLFGMKK